ncbi:MAG: TolC family protein [Bryobacterales bacterium]|nr:TolC family protein [Bryobacterales bacterium]
MTLGHAGVVGLALVAVTTAAGAAPASSTPVRLREAMEAAGRHASTEEARLQLARSQAQYLETQNKTRVELRPSLGLLSFSNPLLLAANLGSGLMIGKRGAPTAATLQSAWFDVLTAELAAERARTQAQARAAQAFYTLLEKQEAAQQSARLQVARQKHMGNLARLVQAARVTALDQLTAETQLLEAETYSHDAETQRRAAAMDLAMLMGRPESAGDLRVADDPSDVPGAPVRPASTNALFERALNHRGDAQALRQRIDAIRAKRGSAGGRVGASALQAGYGYVTGVPGGVSRSAESFLLGGNTARVDLGLTISLRNTGEKQAQEDLMAARAKLLEAEMASLERQVMADVFAARNAIESSEHRLRMARRRVDLAKQAQAMIAARVSSGLGEAGAQVTAEQAMYQAQAELVQAECQRKAGLLALMVMCGLENEAPAARWQALTMQREGESQP